MQVNLLSQLMFLSAIISFLLSLYTWKHKKNPAIFNLSLLLIAVTVWTLGYGLELATTKLHVCHKATFLVKSQCHRKDESQFREPVR